MENTNVLPLLSVVEELASAILGTSSSPEGEPVPVCCELSWKLEVSHDLVIGIPDKGVVCQPVCTVKGKCTIMSKVFPLLSVYGPGYTLFGKKLFDACISERKHLLSVQGLYHNDPWPEEFWDAGKKFISDIETK